MVMTREFLNLPATHPEAVKLRICRTDEGILSRVVWRLVYPNDAMMTDPKLLPTPFGI